MLDWISEFEFAEKRDSAQQIVWGTKFNMIQPTYGDFANGFHQLYHLTITFVTRYHARHQEKSACGYPTTNIEPEKHPLEKDYSSSKPTCLGFHAIFQDLHPTYFQRVI